MAAASPRLALNLTQRVCVVAVGMTTAATAHFTRGPELLLGTHTCRELIVRGAGRLRVELKWKEGGRESNSRHICARRGCEARADLRLFAIYLGICVRCVSFRMLRCRFETGDRAVLLSALKHGNPWSNQSCDKSLFWPQNHHMAKQCMTPPPQILPIPHPPFLSDLRMDVTSCSPSEKDQDTRAHRVLAL